MCTSIDPPSLQTVRKVVTHCLLFASITDLLELYLKNNFSWFIVERHILKVGALIGTDKLTLC